MATEKADTIAVYRLPLKRSICNHYNNCVGVYMRKYAHPGLLFKLFLTDEAMNNLDRYLEVLKDNVVYGSSPSKEMINLEKEFNHVRDCNFEVKPIEIRDGFSDNIPFLMGK